VELCIKNDVISEGAERNWRIAGDTDTVNTMAVLTTVLKVRLRNCLVTRMMKIAIEIMRIAVTFVRMAKPVVLASRYIHFDSTVFIHFTNQNMASIKKNVIVESRRASRPREIA
jgi:hypothetical protein